MWSTNDVYKNTSQVVSGCLRESWMPCPPGVRGTRSSRSLPALSSKTSICYGVALVVTVRVNCTSVKTSASIQVTYVFPSILFFFSSTTKSHSASSQQRDSRVQGVQVCQSQTSYWVWLWSFCSPVFLLSVPFCVIVWSCSPDCVPRCLFPVPPVSRCLVTLCILAGLIQCFLSVCPVQVGSVEFCKPV